MDGLLRDKTRPSRVPPLVPEVTERVVTLTLERKRRRCDARRCRTAGFVPLRNVLGRAAIIDWSRDPGRIGMPVS